MGKAELTQRGCSEMGKWASLDPEGWSAAGRGRPTGWFYEETGMFMCSPVYVAPVLNTHGRDVLSGLFPSGGCWG